MPSGTTTIAINAEPDTFLIIHDGQGSWGDVSDGEILRLTAEQHDELCDGSEVHQLEGDVEVLYDFTVK